MQTSKLFSVGHPLLSQFLLFVREFLDLFFYICIGIFRIFDILPVVLRTNFSERDGN